MIIFNLRRKQTTQEASNTQHSLISSLCLDFALYAFMLNNNLKTWLVHENGKISQRSQW